MPGKRHWGSDGRWDMAVGVAFLLLALATCWSTIGSGFQLGGDEHHEVTKAFLWSEGFRLYHEIWNDQPPLLTVLQGSLFKGFGVYAVLARGLALAFGALLAAGLFRLVRKSLGVPAAFGALFSLLAAPHVFELSLSPMSEVPAFAVGLGALGAIRRWDKDGRGVWLAVSGLVLAFALEIKLTAALLAPALGLELAILTLARSKAGRIVKLARNGAIWIGSVLGGLVLLELALGPGSRQAYASHFSTLTQAAAEVRQLAFTLGDLLRYRQAWVALAAALGLAAWRRHWRPLAFPLALFATALAVHLVHRPFWPYYYLHFAVPVAWLMGYAVGESWKATLDAVRRTTPRLSLWGAGLALAAALLSAGVVAYAGITLASETNKIRGVRRVDADPIVAAMKAAAPGTQWVYTRATMYAFHAKLRVIPELALMPRKRFWSGQVTQAGILALVKRYMPEQLLLDDRDMADAEMAQFVGEHYKSSTRDAGLTLWLKAGR